MQIMVFVKG